MQQVLRQIVCGCIPCPGTRSSRLLRHSQSIRPMPRYQEQAERMLEQLQILRDSVRSLNDQTKQVSRAILYRP